VTRAIEVWAATRAQPGVSALLESGERIHEVPFSCVADHQPGRVLRGTIDCLVRRPDGSIVVIEFKTGAPSPAHQAQLDSYVRAACAMFPDAAVTGRLIYPR
jgi:RecB family exonuclease